MDSVRITTTLTINDDKMSHLHLTSSDQLQTLRMQSSNLSVNELIDIKQCAVIYHVLYFPTYPVYHSMTKITINTD